MPVAAVLAVVVLLVVARRMMVVVIVWGFQGEVVIPAVIPPCFRHPSAAT